jgi:hypothetical protein
MTYKYSKGLFKKKLNPFFPLVELEFLMVAALWKAAHDRVDNPHKHKLNCYTDFMVINRQFLRLSSNRTPLRMIEENIFIATELIFNRQIFVRSDVCFGISILFYFLAMFLNIYGVFYRLINRNPFSRAC